jgi:flagellar biosynthesis protein FlhG
MVITQKRTSKIIPIASGKGGVGKTEVGANLGIRLGQLGYRTALIDLDLGGSNLHSVLGIKNKNPGLGNFLSDKSLKFDELLVETPYENLSFIPGDVHVAGIPNLTFAQKNSIITHIENMDMDYILLDLGSGASNNVVDFFLMSNSGLVVSSPHVNSILNAYGFLKNSVFRFLMRAFSSESKVDRFLRKAIRERRPGQPVRVGEMLDEMKKLDAKQAKKARQYVKMVQPSLVLNMTRSTDDLNIAESLRELVSKNLNVSIQSLGAIMYDEEVFSAYRGKTLSVVSRPNGLVSQQIDRLAQKIVQSPAFPDLALETDMYEDSYQLTRIELEYDEAEYAESRHQQSVSQVADAEEFLSVLSAQRKRIKELQGTVRMLTMKNR